MSESTSTAMEMCANCGVPIISTGESYTHIPRMEDPATDCTDPTPARAADGDEMWHMAIWLVSGAAPEVCDRIRELDGVAYRPGHPVMSEPTKTTTKPVTAIRRTTPSPMALFSCMFGHTYRVVLENNRPIALECVGCTTTWKTERVEREQA